MVALLGVVTLSPNAHHQTTMDGVQLEAQSCVTGVGLYATALSSELYTGGVQYGYPVRLTESATLIGQAYVGASYPSRWVPELPNGVQFDTGVRLLLRLHHTVFEVAWQHDSHGGLGRTVTQGRRTFGNTGLDLLKFGVGWEF
jgi:hypothetical protein